METTNKKHEATRMQEDLQQMLDANIEKLKAMDNAREQTARQLQQVEVEIMNLTIHAGHGKKVSHNYKQMAKTLLGALGINRLFGKRQKPLL